MKLHGIYIPAIYLILGFVWVILSDFFSSIELIESKIIFDISKGLIFVTITSIVLFFLIKSGKRKVKRADEDYKKLFYQNPNPMWIIERGNGMILNVNEAMINKYGYSLSEIIGMNIKQLRPKEDVPLLVEQLRKNINEFYDAGIWRHKNKFGEIFFVNISSYPIEYDGKKAKLVLGIDVSKQVNIQTELKHTNEELKLIFNSITDGLVIIRDDFTIERMNCIAKDFLHNVHGDVIGNNLLDHIHEAMLAKFESEIEKTVESRVSIDFDVYDSTSNIYFLVSAYPYNSHVFLIVKDITELKSKEIELKKSLKRYDTLNKITLDAVWQWDSESNLVIWNDGLKRCFGFDPTSDIKSLEDWLNTIHPDDVDMIRNKLHKVFTEKQTQWKSEYRMKCADGSYKYVLDIGYAIYDANDELQEMMGSLRDIQDEKVYEIELEKLSLVASKINNGVIITDFDDNIEWVNMGFVRMSGYTLNEIIGKNPKDFLPCISETETVNNIISRMKFGKSFTTELCIRHKSDSQIWTRMDFTPIIMDREVKRCIIIITNITDEKLAKNKLEEQNKKLSEFAWSGSHELRAPVARILGLSSLFNFENPLDPENSKVLGYVNDTTLELDEMLKVMLNKCNRLIDKEDLVEIN